MENDYAYLIASHEKTLCDLIVYTPKLRLRFVKNMETFLEEDMRFDMDEFYKMDATIFEQCAHVSKKKTEINNLIELLNRSVYSTKCWLVMRKKINDRAKVTDQDVKSFKDVLNK